ncbi:Autophagy-related protein 37 [Podosphaera aphanis]|nr:Autophagy-related protein 37 [Podosphaera aphanis]
MGDSVDRVFVHALNTVKKIPKAGALRPPRADRLRLYGLYKQAMEGDVDGVMERPTSLAGGEDEDEDIEKFRDKYDSWNAQKGLSRTEAKRKYVEALIETMHKYAGNTAGARGLVDELEYVWDQIKNNSLSSTESSPRREGLPDEIPNSPRLASQISVGHMRILKPRSQNDEMERESQRRLEYNEQDGDDAFAEEDKGDEKNTSKWRRRVEQTLMKMTAEVAALREQIATGREYQEKKRKRPSQWVTWFWWLAVKHFFVDMALLALILIWMRKRKDRRIEDLVRQGVKVAREYLGQILPSR